MNDADYARLYHNVIRPALDKKRRLQDFAEWIVSLDDPDSDDRQTVTLTQIINQAKEALGE